jgi:hypothetical protein
MARWSSGIVRTRSGRVVFSPVCRSARRLGERPSGCEPSQPTSSQRSPYSSPQPTTDEELATGPALTNLAMCR